MDIDLQLPVNFELLRNPMNWLVIVLVLILVFYSAFVIRSNATSLLPQI